MSGESPEYYKTLTLKQAKELAQHGEEGDFLVLDRVTTLTKRPRSWQSIRAICGFAA